MYYFLAFILFFFQSRCDQHTFPFISGDNLRAIANHIFDDRKRILYPEKVKERDIIFVQTYFLQKFFAFYHPKIKHPYILLTHNGDEAIPGKFLCYLQDPKVIAWFGQNVATHHPKLHPIPIGIFNHLWEPKCASTITEVQKKIVPLAQRDPKTHLLYMNISVSTNHAVRKAVYDCFAQKPFCYNAQRRLFANYLQEMAHYCFVISPEGNGLDCHRTWEALHMGCIPIVKSNSLDSMYDGLPVLIVQDWNQVTEEFLQEQLEIMLKKEYSLEKLSIYYWFGKINEYKYPKKNN